MIKVTKLSKSFSTKTLFEDINFTLSKNQKVGLVGPNGVGKSTLIKIIAKLEKADEGSILYGQDTVAYLPQVFETKCDQTVLQYLKKEIKQNWEEYQIDIVLAKVKLSKSKTKLISKLSGGQKMRLNLAKLLLKEPSLLLLDEPTNNLDLEGIIWLEKLVQNFPGNVLFISHDRTFLDNVADKILELDTFNHQLYQYVGNYSDFVLQKATRQDRESREFKIYDTKKRKMEAWMAEKKQQLLVYDNPKVARQLQAMKRRYEREIEKDPKEKPKNYYGFNVKKLSNKLPNKKVVFSIRNLKFFINPVFLPRQLQGKSIRSVGVKMPMSDSMDSNSILFTCSNLGIFGRDRISLMGKNGSGKTTFIKILMQKYADFEGEITFGPNIKIAYFSQEYNNLNPENTVIDEFCSQTDISNEQQARGVLGKYLFKDQQVFARISTLSQGEKVRLNFAILINNQNNFLILDEPTNHLDLESRENIEQALAQFEGGFIIVSHDRYFLNQIGINRLIEIKDKEIKEISI
jgi:ATP-binding cassette, subfamily F, member 3